MKISKSVRRSHRDVIEVSDYRLVAALKGLGYEFPRRNLAWVSEYINEDYMNEAIDESVYIYPRTPELLRTIRRLEAKGIDIPSKNWKMLLDEIKMQYGVGSSKIANFSCGANEDHAWYRNDDTGETFVLNKQQLHL